MSRRSEEWFETWFNTPYYHILYKNKDEEEAHKFIQSLITYLQPEQESHFLDLACGKGRHSITINDLGYRVTGLDLAEKSIQEAQKYANKTLDFAVHDMREVYREGAFNYVFNIFTSFGYFDDIKDNLLVLNAVHKMLKEEGILVIDFMNVDYVLQHLVEKEDKTVDEIDFKISRSFDGTFIYKDISFEDRGKDFHFQEKVQAINKITFEELLGEANFKIVDVFGDIYLNPYQKELSNRIIIIAKKK